jgi:hypothetical protein
MSNTFPNHVHTHARPVRVLAELTDLWVIRRLQVPPAAEKRFAKEFKALMQSLTSFNHLRQVLKLRTLKALSYQLFSGVQVSVEKSFDISLARLSNRARK